MKISISKFFVTLVFLCVSMSVFSQTDLDNDTDEQEEETIDEVQEEQTEEQVVVATYVSKNENPYDFEFINEFEESELISFNEITAEDYHSFDLKNEKSKSIGKSFEITYISSDHEEEDEDGDLQIYTINTITSLKLK